MNMMNKTKTNQPTIRAATGRSRTQRLIRNLPVAALTLCVALFLLPATATAQIWINNVPNNSVRQLTNTASSLMVNGNGTYVFTITPTGVVTGTAGVGYTAGTTTLATPNTIINNGTVGHGNVNRNGLLQNYSNITSARIEGTSATLQNRGVLENRDNAIVGTATIDGGFGTIINQNNAKIGTLTVNTGNAINRDNAVIDTAYVSGMMPYSWSLEELPQYDRRGELFGNLENIGNGHIGTVVVDNYGELDNRGSIDTVNIYTNSYQYEIPYIIPGLLGTATGWMPGHVNNLDGGHIGTVNLDGSNTSSDSFLDLPSLVNDGENAIIDTVNVYGDGRVINLGKIQSLTTHGNGQVSNSAFVSIGESAGYIGELNLNGGSAKNVGSAAVIGTAFLNGGSIVNSARIDNLTYIQGSYSSTQDDFYKYSYALDGIAEYDYAGIGSIGTLTAAGDITGNDWGIVENLQFASDGSGYLTISGYDFFKVEETVDLTNANLTWDLSNSDISWWTDIQDKASSYSFGLDQLFGGADVFGDFDTFEVMTAYGNFTFADLAARGFTYADGVFMWDIESSVPEPATLAIISLGLAGLGLARRRKA